MANGLAGLFGGSSNGGGLSLYPAIFPILFGNGVLGPVMLGTIADVGYLGAFGAPQYTSVTLPSGATITVPAGSGNGGLLMACQGTLIIGGSIVANGGNGGTATNSPATGGAGGGTAGGGAGGASTTGNTINLGQAPARIGHGALPTTSFGAASGAVPPGSGSGFLGAISIAADNTYNLPGMFDPRNGLRFSVPLTASGDTLATAVSSASISSAGPGTRALLPSSIYPLAASLSFDALATGLPGLPGNTILSGSPTGQALGGGGGGGGVVYIEASTIVFEAGHSIQAKGGNGGGSVGGTGLCGGMGGDGGLVILVANQFTGTPNVSVIGGTAGASTSSTPAPLASQAGRFLMIQL